MGRMNFCDEFLQDRAVPEQVGRADGEKERGGHGRFRAEAWRAPRLYGGTW